MMWCMKIRRLRERTQILMDIANQTWGMVIGTGDLSELAWMGYIQWQTTCLCTALTEVFPKHW